MTEAEQIASGVGIVQAAVAVIQIFVTVIALLIARREFQKWRTELLGSKKIELTIRLGVTAFEVKRAFALARPFMGYSRKAPEYRPGSTPDEMRRQDREFEVSELLRPVQEKLQQFEAIVWEASALFGEESSLDAHLRAYKDKFMELWRAMAMSIDGTRSEKDIRIMYGDPAGDEFSKAVENTTNEILKFVHKYTE